MRDLIIANFFLNREFKIFGKMVKVKRAATPTIIAFFIGVLLQTLIDGGWVVTILCWLPFALAIYLGFFYARTAPLKYVELEDWNQQYQYLLKPDLIGMRDETFPEGIYYTSEVKRVAQIHAKYFGGEDNVDVWKGLAPSWLTVIGALLYVWIS